MKELVDTPKSMVKCQKLLMSVDNIQRYTRIDSLKHCSFTSISKVLENPFVARLVATFCIGLH